MMGRWVVCFLGTLLLFAIVTGTQAADDAEARSKEIQALWRGAVAMHQRGEAEGAIENYLRITKLEPKVTQAFTNAAALLIHMGKETDAEHLLREAVKHNPSDYMANLNLAIILSERVDHATLEEALKYARQATVSRPTSQAAFHVLANVYQSLGVPHLAESALRTATNIQTDTRNIILPRVFPEKTSGVVKSQEKVKRNQQEPELSKGETSEHPAFSIVEKRKEYHIVSIHPLIVHIPHFFSEEEADACVNAARSSIMKKSDIYANNAEGVLRSSETTWLRGDLSNLALQKLKPFLQYFGRNRTLDESGMSVEPMQVVHYTPGGFYHAHHDSTPWHPRDVTALYYLSDTNGGKTIFPNICNFARQTEQMCLFRSIEELDSIDVHHVCDSTSAPANVGKGDALLFFNTLPDGEPDPHAAHVACPVTNREKWLANHWIAGVQLIEYLS